MPHFDIPKQIFADKSILEQIKSSTRSAGAGGVTAKAAPTVIAFGPPILFRQVGIEAMRERAASRFIPV
jgi:hypothetical protein